MGVPLSAENLEFLFFCHDYQNLFSMVVIFITLNICMAKYCVLFCIVSVLVTWHSVGPDILASIIRTAPLLRLQYPSLNMPHSLSWRNSKRLLVGHWFYFNFLWSTLIGFWSHLIAFGPLWSGSIGYWFSFGLLWLVFGLSCMAFGLIWLVFWLHLIDVGLLWLAFSQILFIFVYALIGNFTYLIGVWSYLLNL